MTTVREELAKHVTQAQMSSFFIDKIGIFNVKSYGATGDGATDDSGAIVKAVDAADNSGGIVFFPTGTYKISNSLTVPTNVTLWFSEGAQLSIDSTKTVTINGSILAGITQIFSGAGTIAGSPRVSEFYPQWWGAKGDNSTDDTTAIQNTINAVSGAGGGKIYFKEGTYKHTGLTVPTKITLQGSGYITTILDCTSTTANGITLNGSARHVSIFDMKLHSSGASTGWAISGTGGVVGEFTIDRYMISGFKNGIDIWQAINSTIGQGRLAGQGRLVAGGRGIKLGEGITYVSTTVTIGKAYLADYEYLVHNVYCPSLLMVNTIMETSKRGLVTGNYTVLIDCYWEAVDDYDIYADGDGVYVAGGYGLDPAKVFLDATYAANRSVISWGKLETRFYNKVVLGNGGTSIVKHLSATASLDFASIAANTTAELNITVTGAAAGDTVSVTPSGAPEAGLVWSGLAGTDLVTVRLGNVTIAAIDPAIRTWRVDVWKH